jgi:RecA/RadA recombinase
MTTYCTDRNFFEDPDFFKRNGKQRETEQNRPVDAIEPRFIDAADLLLRPYEPPSFLVAPIIPTAGAIVVLTGDTGSGKTALLLHICICVALGLPVAGRFEVSENARPVLYVNGEMSTEVLRMYLHQALAGLGLTQIPHGRFLFEGSDAVATLRFSDPDTRRVLEGLLTEKQPGLVVIDTQRAIMGIDEKDAGEVRDAYTYLRNLANEHSTTFGVAHHVRKIGDVSNSARERVSGSRDILAAADVHLALRSRDSSPVHGLHLGKTRFPVDDIAAGTEWPLEAKLLPALTPSGPLRSVFIAAPHANSDEVRDKLEDAKAQILATLDIEGPMTLEALDAEKGSRKRAYETLKKAGDIVVCGKDGRKTLYGLPDDGDDPDDANAVTNAVKPEPADRTREKPLRDKGSNAVTPDRTHDRAGRFGGESGPPRHKAGTDSRRPQTNAVSGQDIYRGVTADRTRSKPLQRKGSNAVKGVRKLNDDDRTRENDPACGFFVGPADGQACKRCGVQRTEHTPS